jgi:hypothetical protein
MTGDIYRGTLSAKEMSELKTMLASVLTKLDKLDKLENFFYCFALLLYNLHHYRVLS